MTSDALGDRMKMYEKSGERLMPLLPAIVRLDGVCFHTFTKGLQRPYDPRLTSLLIETTKMLVKETNARCGYCQSDEITLLLYSDEFDSQIYFDAKIDKLVSVLAAKTSVFFNSQLAAVIPEKHRALPVFDCRVWNVPNKDEAANAILWRELDATRNSISMAAQTYYSHDQLLGRSSSEKQELLFQQGINWNDYPVEFKRGTYIQRRIEERPFTVEELDRLPKLHEAHKHPELKIKRTSYGKVDLPPLRQVANRVEVLFDGAEPITVSAQSV